MLVETLFRGGGCAYKAGLRLDGGPGGRVGLASAYPMCDVRLWPGQRCGLGKGRQQGLCIRRRTHPNSLRDAFADGE